MRFRFQNRKDVRRFDGEKQNEKTFIGHYFESAKCAEKAPGGDDQIEVERN